MKDLAKKVAVGLTTGALVAQAMVLPAFADLTVDVTGNGANTTNTSNVTQTQGTEVTQSNTANVTNDISSHASTGGNTADYNTGGDVRVSTGGATALTTVTNTLNSNEAQVGCNSCGSDATVTVSGNGARSDNTANLDLSNYTSVDQNNTAIVHNDVNNSAKTGANDANYNTGGDVSVTTGPATAVTQVSNTANRNVASVGTGNGAGSLTLNVSDNGADSENTVNADVSHTLDMSNLGGQNNFAWIHNDVDNSAKTGYNDANYNTGGDTRISTGAAVAGAVVDNMANFNWANIAGCCGMGDLTMKIVHNGANSENTLDADLMSATMLDQHNLANIHNDVSSDAKTGANDANYNGGTVGIQTGNASAGAEVDNQANFNVADVGNCCELSGLLRIADNGADSTNNIDLNHKSLQADTWLSLDQNNSLCGMPFGLSFLSFVPGIGLGCKNDVHANAATGYNDANDSTGSSGNSDPSIRTGNASDSVVAHTTGNSNVFSTGGSVPTPPPVPTGTGMGSGMMNWFVWFVSHMWQS